MKKLFLLLLIVPMVCFGQEISLFNSDGDAVAYIDVNDEDSAIYLWNGTPVAYLSAESNYYNIYGFNGNQFWRKRGVIYHLISCDKEFPLIATS